VTVSIKTAYPASEKIEIVMSVEEPFEFTTKLRIPHWAENINVLINGQPAGGHLDDGYISIKREWKSDDQIILTLPLNLRLEDEYGSAILDKRRYYRTPQVAYFFHGPLILGIDSNHNQLLPRFLQFKLNKPYLTKPGDRSNPYLIDNAHYIIPGQVDNRLQNFYLNPISEHTGYRSWTEELENFKRNGEEPIQRSSLRVQHLVHISKN
jgi:hypothetical protein